MIRLEREEHKQFIDESEKNGLDSAIKQAQDDANFLNLPNRKLIHRNYTDSLESQSNFKQNY